MPLKFERNFDSSGFGGWLAGASGRGADNNSSDAKESLTNNGRLWQPGGVIALLSLNLREKKTQQRERLTSCQCEESHGHKT